MAIITKTESEYTSLLINSKQHSLLSEYLYFHFECDIKFIRNPQTILMVLSWLDGGLINNLTNVCRDLVCVHWENGQYLQFYNDFHRGIRPLFGGMCAMKRDFFVELGYTSEMLSDIFHQATPIQLIQLQMCWEIFWGVQGFGRSSLITKEDYDGFVDDIYATISMSEFTPYYLASLYQTINEPSLVITTIVNIIMDAYFFVLQQRVELHVQEHAWKPIWQQFQTYQMTQNPDYFKVTAHQRMWVYYDDDTMISLIPECIKADII